MRKSIKIKMVDYGFQGYKPENELIYKVLSEKYDIVFSETPEYLISGGYGFDHLKYDCVKILSNSENCVSDFNLFDYAIGHDYLEFGDRYIRMPHYAAYPEYYTLAAPRQFTDEELLNRKFCSFVVSNANCDPIRDKFFHELSKYKRVDSGGRYLNNIGEPVADKLVFCRGYKFNIAFENSSVPGYTTEKIMQPMSVGSVPIYYGNPLVARDFNPASFVQVANEADIPRAIEEIVYLDTHDEAYLEKCRETCVVGDVNRHKELYASFLDHIIEQPLEEAKRLSAYGNQAQKRQLMISLLRARAILHKFDLRRFFR